MNEIPFKIGSSLKWISGISSKTTCKDIMISLLETENLLDCAEETVHHHFALIESWREVSKVLPANSLILKIWTAWGEEQENVSFTVKRIKNPKREKREVISSKNQSVSEENKCKAQKRLKRRNSSNSHDTLHPKALAKSRQTMSKDIQEQMKKIISQGEIIRRHLDQLKSLEIKEKSEKSKSKDTLIDNEDLNDSGHVTDVSETNEENDLNHIQKDISESICDTFKASDNIVGEHSPNETDLRINSDELVSEEETNIFFESFEDTDTGTYILEEVHRMNRLLESKEEQLLTLDLEIKMYTMHNMQQNVKDLTKEFPAMLCFDNEVKTFRELNANLLKEISQNSSLIENLQETTDNRKKLVSQLEFDVNVIERESKRLQMDLLKVDGIGIDLPKEKNDSEQNVLMNIPTPLSSSSSEYCQTSSSEKSVKFCDQDDVFSPSSSICFNPLSIESGSLRRSILKNENDLKPEYGSDVSSDTGVSSLSSSEGDYSLSTLV